MHEPVDDLRRDAVFALGNVGRAKDIALLERVLAGENARATPSARIASETEDSIRRLSARRR